MEDWKQSDFAEWRKAKRRETILTLMMFIPALCAFACIVMWATIW